MTNRWIFTVGIFYMLYIYLYMIVFLWQTSFMSISKSKKKETDTTTTISEEQSFHLLEANVVILFPFTMAVKSLKSSSFRVCVCVCFFFSLLSLVVSFSIRAWVWVVHCVISVNLLRIRNKHIHHFRTDIWWNLLSSCSSPSFLFRNHIIELIPSGASSDYFRRILNESGIEKFNLVLCLFCFLLLVVYLLFQVNYNGTIIDENWTHSNWIIKQYLPFHNPNNWKEPYSRSQFRMVYRKIV